MLAILLMAPLFGLLSTMIVTGRMSFFSDALGHSAFTGIAIVHNRLYIIGKIRVRELIDSMDYSNHVFFSSNQPQSKGYRLITVEAIDVDVNPI